MKHLLLIIACGFLFAVSAQNNVPPVLRTAKPAATPAKPTPKRIKQQPAPKKSQLGPSWTSTPQPLEVIDKATIEEARPRELFEKALESLRAGKPQDALPLLRDAEKLAPKRFEIQMLLGVTFGALRQRDEAVSAFRKAVAINPQNADAHSGLCNALANVDKHFDAIDECREAVKLAPTRTRFRAQLAELYLGNNQVNEALQLLVEADARSQADLVFMGTLGDAHFMAGDYDLAADVYEKIAQKWPNLSVVYLRLSDVYDYLGRFPDAIASAKKFAELEPTLVEAQLNLGRKYQATGFIDEAVASYKQAITLDKNSGKAYLALTEMYEVTGDSDLMLENFRNAYRLLPRTVMLAYEFGNMLASSGNAEEAIEPLELANRLRPNTPAIMRSLALVYRSVERGDEGAALLEQANQLSPLPPNIQINIDPISKKDLLARFAETLAAVKADPENRAKRAFLARIYRLKGMPSEADNQYVELVKLKPTAENYNYAAVYYSESQQHEKAIEAVRKAIEIKPHHVMYLTLASELRDLGRLDEAIVAARKALEMKPNSMDLHIWLGEILLKKGSRTEALREYQTAFELASGDPRPNFRLAWLYIRMGNKEGAFRHYAILRGIAPYELEYLETCLLGRFGELP